MSDFPLDITSYMTTSASKKLIKANGPAEPSKSLLMKYFKHLDEQVVQEFVAHPSNPQYEWAFLNYFTYLAHNDSTKKDAASFHELIQKPCEGPQCIDIRQADQRT